MYNNKKIITGAIIGTLMGSLSAVLRSNRKYIYSQLKDQSKGWGNKAHNISQKVLNEVDHWRKPRQENTAQNFITGALCGLLVGLGSALLFAPKSGKQLRNDLNKTYNSVADKTQEILQFINHEDDEPPAKRPVVKHVRAPAKAKVKPQTKK